MFVKFNISFGKHMRNEGIFVPRRDTFEYSYSVSSIHRNIATVFLQLYSKTSMRHYEYGYFFTDYDMVVLLSKGNNKLAVRWSGTQDSAILKSVGDKL